VPDMGGQSAPRSIALVGALCGLCGKAHFRFVDRSLLLPVDRHELVMPELGMGATPVVASVWLVEVGAAVTEGDRLLEVLAGAVTVDLPSPATGTLAEVFVTEDDALATGQVLAIIDSPRDDEAD
jgi:hypothetical protein